MYQTKQGENDFVKYHEWSEKMLGRLLKHYSLMTYIFEVRINGYKGRGRLRKAFI